MGGAYLIYLGISMWLSHWKMALNKFRKSILKGSKKNLYYREFGQQQLQIKKVGIFYSITTAIY